MEELNFQTLEEELIAYETMTESQATDYYNIDNKAEALQYILDYWQTQNKIFLEPAIT